LKRAIEDVRVVSENPKGPTGRRLGDPWELLLDGIGLFVTVSFIGGILRSDTNHTEIVLAVIAWAISVSRRIQPVAALIAATVLCVIFAHLEQPAALYLWCFAQICLFTVALTRSSRTVIMCSVLQGLGLYGSLVIALSIGPLGPTALGLIAWTAASAGLGSAIRLQRVHVRDILDRAETTLESRRRDVEQRITLERLRIAADLHDVLAHNIAVISVHAGAAEAQLDQHPERTSASLQAIRGAAARTLDELQGLVGVLREPGSSGKAIATPSPGIENITELLTTFREIGLSINADIKTVPHHMLTPTVEVATYRVLQEALTNAHKHGKGRVDIRITRDPGGLRVTVRNAIATSSPKRVDGGFGLIGMRERIISAGGSFDVENHLGVFTLNATLPLNPEQDT